MTIKKISELEVCAEFDVNDLMVVVDGTDNTTKKCTVGHIIGSKQDVLESGVNVKTINGVSVLGSGDIDVSVDLSGKQDVLVSAENIKTINGNDILGSGDLVIDTAIPEFKTLNGETLIGTGDIVIDLSTKQDVLESGVNVKTINGSSILGSGDLSVVTPVNTQETQLYVKNESGNTLTKGQVLIATGTNGNSGSIVAGLGKADGTILQRFFLGVCSGDIDNGDFGYCTNFGKVSGIQTNGANYSENWVDGDVLYVSDTIDGGLTKVQPTAPHLKMVAAYVINAHHSNGVIFVRLTHGERLEDIHDVFVSNPQDGQVLKYNSTTMRWENSF
jgi:hypothetical protein